MREKIDQLLADLMSFSDSKKYKAADELIYTKEPRAIEALEPLLCALRQYEDLWLRKLAAEALGNIKSPRAVDALIHAMRFDVTLAKKHPDIEQNNMYRHARCCAADALGEIKDPRALRDLIDIMDGAAAESEDCFMMAVGFAAGRALRSFGALAVEALIDELENKHSMATRRTKVAEVLGEIRDVRAIKPLIDALQDKDWRVRMFSANALGKVRNPHATGSLIAVQNDKHPSVREEVAKALKAIEET